MQKVKQGIAIAILLFIFLLIGMRQTDGQSIQGTLVGAGDIARCGTNSGDEITAGLLDQVVADSISVTVFTVGDNAYPSGTVENFNDCYEPSWGRHKVRTRPAGGNHDYITPKASAYFAYFGANAGDPDKGYYAYDLGSNTRVYVLNGQCGEILGGCSKASPQAEWLRTDIGANPRACVVVINHYPLFNSGQFGNDKRVRDLIQILYELAGLDISLAGHAHNYESSWWIDLDGNLNPNGILFITAGTGGGGHGPAINYPWMINTRNFNNTTYGVVKLTFYADNSYEWEFLPEPGEKFTDRGEGSCNGGNNTFRIYQPLIRSS